MRDVIRTYFSSEYFVDQTVHIFGVESVFEGRHLIHTAAQCPYIRLSTQFMIHVRNSYHKHTRRIGHDVDHIYHYMKPEIDHKRSMFDILTL